ncbi:N-acetyltransferase family protein [Polaromonas sp.]|uniref:GNAT family N-acetyltransferase n=1 Tax=Polaromonas sp. TaxID=1869339 RepID=UPI003CAB10EE
MTFSELEEEIVELDRLNMAANFVAANSVFEPSIRLERLRREIANGAKLLGVRRDARLVAYLEYVPPVDGRFYVPSLQIHPQYKGTSILRPLLAQAAACIKTWPTATLRTRVHASNEKSIRLHQKLGFSRVPSLDGRVHFEVSSAALYETLKGYCATLSLPPNSSYMDSPTTAEGGFAAVCCGPVTFTLDVIRSDKQ